MKITGQSKISLLALMFLSSISWYCQPAPPSFKAQLVQKLQATPQAWEHMPRVQGLLNQRANGEADSVYREALKVFQEANNPEGVFWTLAELAILRAAGRSSQEEIDSLRLEMQKTLPKLSLDIKPWAEIMFQFVEGFKWYRLTQRPYLEGKAENAIMHIDSILKRSLQIPGPPHETLLARIYFHLGDIYFQAPSVKDNFLAVEYLEKGLLLDLQEAPSLELSNRLLIYGWLQAEEGAYDLARQIQTYTLAIRQHFLGPKHLLVANPWNQIGKSYYEKGDFELARQAYSQAYEIMQEHDYPSYWVFYLNNLTSSLEQLGFYEEALQNYQQVGELISTRLDNHRPLHVLNEQNKAALYVNLDRFEEAIRALSHADRLIAGDKEEEITFFVSVPLLWAELYLKTGENEQGREAINRARSHYEIVEENGRIKVSADLEPDKVLETLSMSARLFEANLEVEKALAEYLLLLDYAHEVRWYQQLESDQLFIGELVNQAVEQALDIAHNLWHETGKEKYLAHAYHLMEQSKSQVLQQELAKAAFLQKSRYKVLLSQDRLPVWPGDNSEENLQDSHAFIRDLIYEVHRSSQTLIQVTESLPVKGKSLSLDQVGQSLADDELLISYTMSDELLWELSVSKDHIWLRKLGLSNGLETSIDSFRRAVSLIYEHERHLKIATLGRQLYQTLLAPVFAFHYPDRDLPVQVNFIPDRTLFHFPFELLLTEEHEGEDFRAFPFLIHRTAVNYGFSIDLYHRTQPFSLESGKTGWGLLIDALPEYSISEEVEYPLGLETKRLFGREASKSHLLKEAPDYDLIQVICHGFANDENGQPYLMLNGERKAERALFTDEVAAMPLSADLVILTACEGGLGEIQKGEGSLSMLRALRMAGSENLVAGLWEVYTKPLPGLLNRFYTELTAGTGIPEALRQAKLEQLREAGAFESDPAFWAPMVSFSQ